MFLFRVWLVEFVWFSCFRSIVFIWVRLAFLGGIKGSSGYMVGEDRYVSYVFFVWRFIFVVFFLGG